MSDEEGCPVCRLPAELPHVLDVAMATYAEEVYRLASGGSAAEDRAAEDREDMEDMEDNLAAAAGNTQSARSVRSPSANPACARCAEGCISLLSQAASVQADMNNVRQGTEEATARFEEEVAMLHAALDAAAGGVRAALRADRDQRVKALEVVADELTVSASHLDTAASLGAAAMASGDTARMLSAATCMLNTQRLAFFRTAHGVQTGAPPLTMDCDTVAAAIAALVPTQAGVLLCKRADGANAVTFARLLTVAALPGCAAAFCEAVADACTRDADARAAAGPTVVAAVLAAMLAQPASAECQGQGLRALRRLLASDDCVAVYDNDNMAACALGVGTIVAAMERHVLQQPVSSWGCAVLYRLGRDPFRRAALVTAGGLTRVLAAMDAWEGCQTVAVQGCAALAHFADTYPGGQAAFAMSGGLAGLARLAWILNAWPACAKVTGVAMTALHNMCVLPDNKAAIVSTGCLASVCAAMAAYPLMPHIQRIGCRLLCKLAALPEGKAILLAGRGVELLECAVVTYPGCADTQKKAAAALVLLRAQE